MMLGSPGGDVFFLVAVLPVCAAAGAVAVDAVVAWLAARVRG